MHIGSMTSVLQPVSKICTYIYNGDIQLWMVEQYLTTALSVISFLSTKPVTVKSLT
jgi:hypothetical protein